MSASPLPPPIVHPGTGDMPIVLSLPHSGRDIDDSLARSVVGGRDSLFAMADPHVDTLAERWIERGLAAVVARTPRAVIDPNRRLDELDPLVSDCPPPPPGSKAARGIGLVPSRGRGRKPLWKVRLGQLEVDRRIAQAWQPYHDALAQAVTAAQARHGEIVLLDLHSMPPPRKGQARVVIGDRHGSSASAWVSETLEAACLDAGEPAARNAPFAGGAIVARHGAPEAGVHAVQIEFDRALYLDTRLARPGPGLGRTAQLLDLMIEALLGGLAERALPRAAE